MKEIVLLGVALVAALLPGLSRAASPTPTEIAEARAWVAANFAPVRNTIMPSSEPAGNAKPGLVVLNNHGPVLFNGRPDGRRLKIQNTEYARGLLCHAPSRVVVHLPGPGKTFASTVGVDTNAGGGSVILSVGVGGKEAFCSEIQRGGGPGVPVSVDLAGATEFTIAVGAAGDGIACDHADWADAKVILKDGTQLWLSDLPVLALPRRPRNAATPPFSFVYGGKLSDELLGHWKFAESTRKLDAIRKERTQTYTDPKTGLAVRCVLVQYDDFPTVEWTLYFKNTGTKDTPILEQIQALDAPFQSSGGAEFVLHHNVGSPCKAGDFAPLKTPLGPGASKQISGAGGRPTSEEWSYFNLEKGGTGVIVVVGWPGQWAATFSREQSDSLRVSAGQERTHFKLHPGEEVRTPLIVLQFWQEGDWIRAQNIWRRWMVAHSLPRPGGKLVPTQFGGCTGDALPQADAEIVQIEGALEQGVKLHNWIIDAGWYPCGNTWTNVGTWEPDAKRFPHGMRQVADHLHAKGIEFVVWFEPERVAAGTWLANNHPEWVLGGKNGGLLNLGNPDAWKWVVEHFDGLLVSQGIDVYRQDFNMDPLSFWQANDAEDRQGITEIKHVTGYLAFWDELLRRHPKLWIDSCASGGRRNDLETMRRAVPLLRSDWPVIDFSPAGATGQQGQTFGLSLWLPFYGTGAPLSDAYTMRSSFAPAYRVGWNAKDKGSNYALLRRMVADFQRVKDYMLGDFYPLTPYSLDNNAWMAWQFDRPQTGDGMIQAFRRKDSVNESMRVALRGLEPDAIYTLTNLDVAGTTEMTGRELMDGGLPIIITDRPAAAIIIYKKKS